MASKALLLVALCICIVPTVLSFEAVPKPFRIMGRVYCDTCRAGFETNVTTYISGAKVRIECRERSNLERVFSAEGVTDSTGTYNVEVRSDHKDQICEAVFVSSPWPDCRRPDPGRSRSSVVLTRFDNGIKGERHFANSLGCFKDIPLPHCPQILQYYLADV